MAGRGRRARSTGEAGTRVATAWTNVVADERGFALSLLNDVRFAARRLIRRPGFSGVAVLILALGLGTITAMFSLVNAALLRSLPYPDPDRLVRVQVRGEGSDVTGYDLFQPFVFRHLRQHNDVLSGMAAVRIRNRGLAHPGQAPMPVSSMSVTADYFSMMGMAPALGRVFLPDDDQPGHNRVVVLSDRLWKERFGGDPQIIGRSLMLGDQLVMVVGVMPAAFNGPVHRWTRAELWRPMGLTPAALRPDSTQHLEVFGRLAPGVTKAAATGQLTTLAARLSDGKQRTVSVSRLAKKSALNEEIQIGAWLALGLAGFVLLIACTNLAGMQLARLVGRGHEQAIRLALGASRGRLVREAIIENLLVSLAGAALGILLAWWSAGLVGSRLILDDGPQTTVGIPVEIDLRVLAFAVAAAVVSAVFVGTAPAWLARSPLFDTLRRGSHGTTARTRPRLGQSLVVAQMAMALVLLMGGGLFLRGLQRTYTDDPGWQMDGLMTGRLSLSGPRYDEPSARAAFLNRLQQRLSAIPGVEGSAMSEWVPVAGHEWWSIGVEGQPAEDSLRSAYIDAVSPEYFDVLGIALRAGRPFGPTDNTEGVPVVMVNERMAREVWPGGNPIGKRISLAAGDWTASAEVRAWRTVVGVVADIRYPGALEELETRYQVYRPIRQALPWDISIALRAHGPPGALGRTLRAAVAELDPRLAVDDARSVRALIDDEIANYALTGRVIFSFAVLGVLLAALGVYGLFSAFVAERTREIGVRVALGADRKQVVGLVLGKGLRLALIGALIGMLGAVIVAPALRAVAYELPAHEPLAIVLLAGVLVAVALFACWIPARRAAALEPMVALRQE
jgi:putative ABC transport system permease protein